MELRWLYIEVELCHHRWPSEKGTKKIFDRLMNNQWRIRWGLSNMILYTDVEWTEPCGASSHWNQTVDGRLLWKKWTTISLHNNRSLYRALIYSIQSSMVSFQWWGTLRITAFNHQSRWAQYVDRVLWPRKLLFLNF